MACSRPSWLLLGDSAYLTSGEDEALGREHSGPKRVARGQREPVVVGRDEHRSVGRADNLRTRDLVDVEAVLRLNLHAVAWLEVAETKPEVVMSRHGDVAGLPWPRGARVVSGSVSEGVQVDALSNDR